MIFAVDASAAVEYLLQTAVGRRVAGTVEAGRLVAPELLDAEVWGVERVAHRSLVGDIWALRGHVSAYDVFYVAVARNRGATLLTADGPLSRAPGLGVAVQNVRLA